MFLSRGLIIIFLIFFSFYVVEGAIKKTHCNEDELMQALMTVLSDNEVQKMFNNQRAEDVVLQTKPHETYLIQQHKRMNFYRDYIAKYYPKAFVITEQIFMAMSPDEIEQALATLVDVLAHRTWKYFVNKDQKNSFKITYYWEYVIDQMSLIHAFLKKAYINLENKTVFIPKDADDFLWDLSFLTQFTKSHDTKKSGKPLLQYLTSNGKTVMFDFYALIFDYHIKLFNEGILLKDVKQARRYLAEIDCIAQKLRGSEYEQEYTEILKTAYDLMVLLKQKLGLDKDEMLHDDSWRREGAKSVSSSGW